LGVDHHGGGEGDEGRESHVMNAATLRENRRE